MSNKAQVQEIVKKALPGVQIVQTLEAAPTRGADLKRVHKAPKLDVMQRKVTKGAEAAKLKPATAAAKKQPSGVVMVAPKNADGPASRRKAKAVIVSRGKVIAVQG
jgi:hypothetical protein